LAILTTSTKALIEDPAYKDASERKRHSRLSWIGQGIGMGNNAGGKKVAGTITFYLITFAVIPHHKQKEVIYTKVLCEIREGKDDENCMRITVGGNLICYPADVGTNTALLVLIKLMLYSVISRKGSRFACIDIKSFTLTRQWNIQNTSVSRITDIPEEFILE